PITSAAAASGASSATSSSRIWHLIRGSVIVRYMTAQPDLEQSTTTGWPWRLGNEFRLLNDGGEFFARMLAAIEEARRYVLLEMYLVRSGAVATRFIDALGRAAGRGARVCVMFDGFGALGLTRADRRRRRTHRRFRARSPAGSLARAHGRDPGSGDCRLAARVRAHLAPLRAGARARRAAGVRGARRRRGRPALAE